jgi:hypothetical protein
MEAGNAFLPDFMEDYNARFAVTPARLDDLHRPLNRIHPSRAAGFWAPRVVTWVHGDR